MAELLAPAGTLEKLIFAIKYGADAVYASGVRYGMRAYAGNFSLDDLAAGIAFAHQHGRKVYVTVNIIPHNDDLAGLPEYLRQLSEIGADAVILADPAVLVSAREVIPEMELHLSTQANAVNWQSVRFWAEQGIRRVILARELSLAEVAQIRRRVPDVELEMFVHGAMCISYSGRCLLSNYMTGRDANRGECAHPCRYSYALVEEKRPGQYFGIEEDERGSYIMNSKDLCLFPHLREVLQTGIDGLKIEGRMKSVHYVATVTRAYRLALAALARGEEPLPELARELRQVSHRAYTTGFAFGPPTNSDHLYAGGNHQGEAEFLGIVRGFTPGDGLLIEQRGNFRVGQSVEFIGPTEGPLPYVIPSMLSAATRTPVDTARHAQELLYVPFAKPISEYAIMRSAPA
ncbi:MAG: U32 family peptidase [Selenomonadales bacterium]|nr:U32 family peptidase [Selenomonadales bacterium]